MRRLLVLMLLTALGAAAQESTWVTFRCDPADATVLLQRPGTSPQPIGKAGTPLQLSGSQPVTLVFRKPGWKEREVQLTVLSGADYPPAGEPPIQLEPDPERGWDRLVYWLSRNGPTLGGLLLLIVGASVTLPRLRAAKAGQLREQHLATLRASLPEQGPLSMQVLGGHLLLEPLSEGGMATVYRAVPEESLTPDQAVAVKVLSQSLSEDAEFRKRWRREFQISADLKHPNVVRVLDFGEQDGRHYLTLELLRGKPLDQLASSEGMPWRQALGYLMPAMEGLAHAHAQGITHRDLKPENLFVTDEGVVKVIDFGVARGEDYTVATRTGVAMGTPTYMAPEQIRGEVDPSSDQYGLAVVLYELLTGKPPFESEDPMQLIMLHTGSRPRPLRRKKPDIPEQLETVVLRMLAKSPADRFPDMRAAHVALSECLELE